MNRALNTIVAALPLLSGCHAVMYGNLAVLALNVGRVWVYAFPVVIPLSLIGVRALAERSVPEAGEAAG